MLGNDQRSRIATAINGNHAPQSKRILTLHAPQFTAITGAQSSFFIPLKFRISTKTIRM